MTIRTTITAISHRIALQGIVNAQIICAERRIFIKLADGSIYASMFTDLSGSYAGITAVRKAYCELKGCTMAQLMNVINTKRSLQRKENDAATVNAYRNFLEHAGYKVTKK